MRDLMCALARPALTEAHRKIIVRSLADSMVDPGELAHALDAHGLTPLAYHHLVGTRGFTVPAVLANRLSTTFRYRASRQAQLVRRLRQLLSAFQASGLDVRPYKGPVLAIQLYGHYAMRQYGDLDLLVHPDHADEAEQVLRAEGIVPQDGVPAAWDSYLRRTRHTRTWRDRSTGLAIELHWRLLDRMYGPEISLDWLMEEPEVVDLWGRSVRAIGAERLLLALALHGAKHQWERLCWLAEVAHMIRSRPDLDWTLIADQAAHLRFIRPFAVTLLLARDLFEAAPPDPRMLRLIDDVRARQVADRILQRLSRSAAIKLTAMERFRLACMVRDGWLERATFGWRVMTHVSPADLAGRPSRFRPVPVIRRALRLIRIAAADRRRRAL